MLRSEAGKKMSKAKFSVLVVEDEKLIARNISRSIQRVNSSFEVVAIASNGEEALAITDELLERSVYRYLYADHGRAGVG